MRLFDFICILSDKLPSLLGERLWQKMVKSPPAGKLLTKARISTDAYLL
jgi:hypothetical protein